MNLNDKFRILVKEMGLTDISFDGIRIFYRDRWYWLTYCEDGRETPTTVGFPESERIGLDYTGGRDTLVVYNENGFQRFTRRLLDDIHFFEMEASFDNIEKLIKRGVKFSIVEDGEDKFRLGDYEAEVTAAGDGLSLKFNDSIIWIYLSKRYKIRIYV